MNAEIVYMEDGEIAVMNKSDFYVCHLCGYAESDLEAKLFARHMAQKHSTSRGYPCNNDKLTKYSLGNQFKTDAVELSLNTNMSYDEAYSVLQAIILSACKVLNIDDGEISGCLQYASARDYETYDFIIYDATPGGAGHVKRFSSKETMRKILKGALDIAKKCDCGGEEADTSCYKCLRTYKNQMHHDILKRKYVIDKLSDIEE